VTRAGTASPFEASAGRAQRVSESDGSAARVHPYRSDLGLPEPGEDDGSEGLVDLHGVDVVRRQAGLLQCMPKECTPASTPP
jgi:hypothetical protein